MELAVCEAPAVLEVGDAGWKKFVDKLGGVEPDLFLLNEMPFGAWVSTGYEFRQAALENSLRCHADGVAHLSELGPSVVLGSRPVSIDARNLNEAFVWTDAAGVEPVHTKQFFPNEPGFFEARWFERGERKFGLAEAWDVRIGFLICTDVMFNEWARYYGRRGAHLIAVPRATPEGSTDRWKTMCKAAAIVSGCYVASSNRVGTDDSGLEFAGRGWIVSPTGEVIAETSESQPVVSATIDVSLVNEAQREYPCYVEELASFRR